MIYGKTFDEWWKGLSTDGLPNVQRYRVVCKMAYTEGQKRGRTIEGQTIEQWRERAQLSEHNLAEWTKAHSQPMPYGIGDSPEHVQTDKCGFDRNSSISEDRYVCDCGWRDG